MPATNFIPRIDRDILRGRIAADRLRSAGGKAIDAALEHVGVAFDLASVHNRYKTRVEGIIRAGASHPEIRARFRHIVAHVAENELDIHDTLGAIAGWAEVERQALLNSRRYGRGTRLPLMQLDEARLALRWIRRFHLERFGQVVRELAGVEHLAAAE